MLYNGPNDYSSTVTYPFDKCPNLPLAMSSTSACLGNCQDTLNKNVLYDMKNLNTMCPKNKTYEKCIDDRKSLFIFSGLFSNNDISEGKCGDLDVIASSLNICTPGMDKITNYFSKNNDISQTFAKEIRNVCNFPFKK